MKMTKMKIMLYKTECGIHAIQCKMHLFCNMISHKNDLKEMKTIYEFGML